MPLSLTNGSGPALNLGMVKILRPMGARIAWDPQGLFGMTPPLPRPKQVRPCLTCAITPFSLEAKILFPFSLYRPRVESEEKSR